MEIPKYIFEDKIWYRYLHISGGSGDKGKKYPSGGEYDYLVTYLMPEEFRKIGDSCIRFWCQENKVPFGVGPTIEAAYESYLESKKLQDK